MEEENKKNHIDSIDIEILRHSASHIMADAILKLFPDTKLAIGPAIENGFFYDFESSHRFVLEDLEKIENEMQKIIESNYEFVKKEISKSEAEQIFKNNKYKMEIINEIQDKKITIYKHGDFIDLCKGPHVKFTGDVKYFKLLSIAGAYWRGDEHREQLQRIYGTAFFSKEDLDSYLKKLEEIKKRDHRTLGKQLEIFSFHDEVGSGLIHWHPKGTIIKNEIEDFWKHEHLKNGYELVSTPHIASEEIYRISGHLEKYSDLMYSPIEIDDKPYRVKPMNCPNHIMIYKTKLHSYKELPVRYAELGSVYRYEKSGVLHGLLRVRGFTIDDAHIFCREDQLEQEMLNIFNFTIKFLKTFGFQEFEIYLATKPDKYVGTDKIWEKATNILKESLEKTGYSYKIDKGGGAFYGPKMDLKIKDVLNRLWQCTTIQFDFNLPERFDINYRDESGKEKRVVMIHRALLGSLERFIGLLLEQYAGKLPLWLSPVQVVIITVSQKHQQYATEIYQKLIDNSIRVELNIKNETIGYKIREFTLQKIPYAIIIGDKEIETKTVTVRTVSGKNFEHQDFNNFIEKIKTEIKEKFL